MAQKLYTLGICERKGSGIDRAITAIEERCLPPVKITKNETHTRIFLYPPKKFGEMDNEERIRACYQHACILNESGGALTNQSFRERILCAAGRRGEDSFRGGRKREQGRTVHPVYDRG